MRQVIKIEGNVTWSFHKDAESNRIVAICEPLAITMEGENLKDLRLNIDEALQMLMVSLVEAGDFDKFLRDRGWSAQFVKQTPGAVNDAVFKVPYELIARDKNDRARVACH